MIGNISEVGWSVSYENGDICNGSISFSSQINYVCDPAIEIGRPRII